MLQFETTMPSNEQFNRAMYHLRVPFETAMPAAYETLNVRDEVKTAAELADFYVRFATIRSTSRLRLPYLSGHLNPSLDSTHT